MVNCITSTIVLLHAINYCIITCNITLIWSDVLFIYITIVCYNNILENNYSNLHICSTNLF